MKNILVVNVNWLGDAIFSSPIFKALKEAYPQARISCLAVPRVREILESIPFIDEVIVYDEKGRHGNLFAKMMLSFHLFRKRFDAAFLLHRSLTRALLVYCAGIPVRVGYDTKGRGKFLTHKVEPLDEEAHRSDYYLHVIESYGVPVNDRRCLLSVSACAQSEIDHRLASEGIQEGERFVVVNPGGNWDLKQWPAQRLRVLIDRLILELRLRVVVVGAAKDRALVQSILTNVTGEPVVLTGETSLKQLMALMRRAHVVISADSGPLHLANGVGANVIGLFGPTRPEVTGPRGWGQSFCLQKDVGCNREPCYHLRCPENLCMKAITVEDVLEVVRQIKNP